MIPEGGKNDGVLRWDVAPPPVNFPDALRIARTPEQAVDSAVFKQAVAIFTHVAANFRVARDLSTYRGRIRQRCCR